MPDKRFCSRFLIALLLAAGSLALAQQPASPSLPAADSAAAPSAAAPDPVLDQIVRTAQAASLNLARLRVDKWKTNGDVKQQTQSNVDSLSRNMSSALPGIVQQVRSAPQSLAAEFKLYRNLNALYDVYSNVTESAGAFGPKQEYDALSSDLNSLDQERRTLADRLEQAATQQDAEVARIRAAQRQAAAAAAAPPKKVVVDNGDTTTSTSATKKPAKKTTKKTPPPPPQ